MDGIPPGGGGRGFLGWLQLARARLPDGSQCQRLSVSLFTPAWASGPYPLSLLEVLFALGHSLQSLSVSIQSPWLCICGLEGGSEESLFYATNPITAAGRTILHLQMGAGSENAAVWGLRLQGSPHWIIFLSWEGASSGDKCGKASWALPFPPFLIISSSNPLQALQGMNKFWSWASLG